MKKLLILCLAAYVLAAIISCKGVDNATTPVVEENIMTEGTVNVKTFNKVRNTPSAQGAEGTFTLPTDIANVKAIKMFIKNDCPNKTCDEWDRYANVYVKNKGEWYEIGRFITPYWVGTEKLARGLEIDVTDFKSLLTGKTELKIYTETWLDKGREYSVDFDFIYGTPDYKYSAVIPVIQYNKSSIDGVPYGKAHMLNLKKNIKLPSNTQKAYLRTIISGWGQATPSDPGGRTCAEWCFRTHNIAINNVNIFPHQLAPLGCANNPINNQDPGNWKPDRAGWCPGMVVPTRIDVLNNALIPNTFSYEYKFQNWTNNGSNGNAFYAISTFIIAKSNTPINPPVVTD
jgi:hypothetical protein